MPTIIALDVSLSMQRIIPGRSDHTYHQLAIKGISQLLDNLASTAKLEYVSLLVYSSTCELKVDFTRDYDQVRQAVKKLEPGDKVCVLSMLKTVASIMVSNWGSQNVCQVVVFTDCGIGFGSTSIKNFIQTYSSNELDPEYAWLKTLKEIKLNFICMGLHSDSYFTRAVAMYQQLLEFVGFKGQLFMTKQTKDIADAAIALNVQHTSHKSELGRTAMFELIERLCETSFRPLDTVLKCGSYFRLESPIFIWPMPAPYQHSNGQVYMIGQKIEICGFLAFSDVGSPASLSRHLILPKVEREKPTRRSSDKNAGTPAKLANNVATKLDATQPFYEYEKLEQEIRDFYTKEGKDTDDNSEDVADVTTVSKSNSSQQYHSEHQREFLCVLLHGALKLENMVALVLLGDKWYGFIYAFSDTKKKSNLMLNILPPGNNVIPWLGDLESLGFAEDLQPGETNSFPVKAEKRSYSQSCVVWIRHASLQSDIQKVLRHAKKIPDKMQHFYKELNRIRRAALSIGFIELLEALATLLEKECHHLSLSNASTECTLQLQHAAKELRKTTHRDLKVSIVPLQKFVAGTASTPAVTESASGFIY